MSGEHHDSTNAHPGHRRPALESDHRRHREHRKHASATATPSAKRSHTWRQLAPYQQGSLDGLRGLYTIINALVFVSASHRRLSHPVVEDLFTELLQAIDRAMGLFHALHHCIDTGPLVIILGEGVEFLANDHGLVVTIKRPWEHKPDVSLRDLYAGSGAPLARERSCSSALGLSRPCDGSGGHLSPRHAPVRQRRCHPRQSCLLPYEP